MKAIVYYRVGNDRATRKTIEVEKNEPCSIVREFVKAMRVSSLITRLSDVRVQDLLLCTR